MEKTFKKYLGIFLEETRNALDILLVCIVLIVIFVFELLYLLICLIALVIALPFVIIEKAAKKWRGH